MRLPLPPFGTRLTRVGCSDGPTDNPGTENPVEQGPRAIPLDGDTNGTSWDAASETLYIADDQNHRILEYRDGEGVSLAAEMPDAPPNSTHLGEVVRRRDGTRVTVRFGLGAAGYVQRYDTAPLEDPGRRGSWLALARATVSVP